MIKIPKVSKYKEYILTDVGVQVLYLNGSTETLIANRTLKSRLSSMNMTLDKNGNIVNIENNENNVDAKAKNNNNTKSVPSESKSESDGAKKASASKNTTKPAAKRSPAKRATTKTDS